MATKTVPANDPQILEAFHVYLPKPSLPQIKYNPEKFIVTPAKNKVSMEAIINGSANIVLQGYVIIREKCFIRGDLANIRFDVNTILMPNVMIRPPIKQYAKGVAFFPMIVGSNTIINENSIISSIQVGNYVWIGKNVILGKRTLIRDCVIIEDDVVLPPDTSVPPFTRVKAPCQMIYNDLGYSFKNVMQNNTKTIYTNFVPEK